MNNKNFVTVDILCMNNDIRKSAYGLDFLKMTKKSIYAKSLVYGVVYKIDVNTGRLYINGKKVANFCLYNCI